MARELGEDETGEAFDRAVSGLLGRSQHLQKNQSAQATPRLDSRISPLARFATSKSQVQRIDEFLVSERFPEQL
jgi:hypothetical protein